MKRVILTGASDGLGKEIGKLLLKDNVEIIALCRTKPNYQCEFIKCDLSKELDIKKASEVILKQYSNFDALINCAGIPCIQPTNNTPYFEFENVMKINVIAPMFIISNLFDLIKKNEADIINIGSTVGTKAGPINQVGYVTSKWAIRGTSLNLQNELKNTNCRVIQINAGGMNTQMHEKYNGSKIENPKEWIDPRDMAKFIVEILYLPKSMEISEISINRKCQK